MLSRQFHAYLSFRTLIIDDNVGFKGGSFPVPESKGSDIPVAWQ